MSAVLITGASKGIGRAVAVELSSRGHRVIATARHNEATERRQVRESPIVQHQCGSYSLAGRMRKDPYVRTGFEDFGRCGNRRRHAHHHGCSRTGRHLINRSFFVSSGVRLRP
ncbi:SDR family NAD(P)-dependent oxidoreductase [Nonomuraea sp. NPDC050643]|uniref:SDR family NAD(P)-dependent oxidoreductase n=1 Tax=Nonomuraea sp. NPDC050643 TaxID=3155660 RepID=UPI0033DCDD44